MPAPNPPSSPADQLQWLVDRAAISDVLIDFARAADEQDWEGYAANYAPDGVLAIAPTIHHEGRDEMAEFVSASLGRYARTHHISANHAIRIDGDRATTRSYLIATHVFDSAEPFRHADGAGWYDCELRRTDEGWRFTRVALHVTHVSGESLMH